MTTTTYTSRFADSPIDWKDPDLSVLDDRRAPVPSVPLEGIAEPRRDWIADTHRATGAPTDYVLQSVLAGVAAVCGAGVSVRVTPSWSEPLVLWQAAVGEASSGKSVALAAMRRLLETIEQERRAVDVPDAVPTQVVATDVDLSSLADIVAGNPRGVLMWRDGAEAWIGAAEEGDHRSAWLPTWEGSVVTVRRPRQPPRTVARFPISILETVRPDWLKEQLQAGGDGFAARFLFVWPGPQPYRKLAIVEPSRDEAILQRLRALSRLARSADDPCVLTVDARGVAALDGVLAGLHADRAKAEGLEAAWLGKSRSLIVRLAGILELLASIDGKVVRPGAIGREQIEAAAALWRDYFWPHAKAVFDSAELSDHTRRVRRVARWLLDKRPESLAREEVRRRVLSMSATADETESVLQRLHYLGYVQPDPAVRKGPGRPSSRWLVNPAIAETSKPVAKFA